MTYLTAAIQMNAGPDKAANLERAERLVRLGAARAADQEGVVVAPIDLEYQERVRRELPALKHARLKGK